MNVMLNLSNTRMKNQFDERKKQDWLVQKFGLRRPQRFDAILAESPFPLNQEEDKRRVCSQSGNVTPVFFFFF